MNLNQLSHYQKKKLRELARMLGLSINEITDQNLASKIIDGADALNEVINKSN